MSSIQAFAKEASTLCVGATAFVLGDPSGGTLLATPLAALGALGLTLNAGCAAKADQKARDAVLQQLGTTGAFAAEHIDRARAILKDAPATAMLDPKALAHLVHGSDLEDTLTAALLDQLAIGADDHQVRRLIETALRAGIAACKGDADFRSGLTLELILISARQQKIAIRTLGDIKQGVDDIKTVVRGSAAKLDALPGTFEESLRSFTHASRDQLEAIAARFEIAQIYDMSDAALRQALENKAADYRALRAEIAALNGVSARIDNIRGAAEAALEIPDFDQANQLLEDAREIIRDQLREPLETNATLMEKQAEIALLRGRAEQAFALLSAAADSFAGIDPLEPARRRFDYMKRLYQQGLRYGGKGLELATRMTEDALSALDRTADPQLWANSQNNLANALRCWLGRSKPMRRRWRCARGRTIRCHGRGRKTTSPTHWRSKAPALRARRGRRCWPGRSRPMRPRWRCARGRTIRCHGRRRRTTSPTHCNSKAPAPTARRARRCSPGRSKPVRRRRRFTRGRTIRWTGR